MCRTQCTVITWFIIVVRQAVVFTFLVYQQGELWSESLRHRNGDRLHGPHSRQVARH